MYRDKNSEFHTQTMLFLTKNQKFHKKNNITIQFWGLYTNFNIIYNEIYKFIGNKKAKQ